LSRRNASHRRDDIRRYRVRYAFAAVFLFAVIGVQRIVAPEHAEAWTYGVVIVGGAIGVLLDRRFPPGGRLPHTDQSK
jgi:lipoprotein signal peptidase